MHQQLRQALGHRTPLTTQHLNTLDNTAQCLERVPRLQKLLLAFLINPMGALEIRPRDRGQRSWDQHIQNTLLRVGPPPPTF